MFLWEYSNRNWMVLPTKKKLCVTDLMVDDNDYHQKRKIDVTKMQKNTDLIKIFTHCN